VRSRMRFLRMRATWKPHRKSQKQLEERLRQATRLKPLADSQAVWPHYLTTCLNVSRQQRSVHRSGEKEPDPATKSTTVSPPRKFARALDDLRFLLVIALGPGLKPGMASLSHH